MSCADDLHICWRRPSGWHADGHYAALCFEFPSDAPKTRKPAEGGAKGQNGGFAWGWTKGKAPTEDGAITGISLAASARVESAFMNDFPDLLERGKRSGGRSLLSSTILEEDDSSDTGF